MPRIVRRYTNDQRAHAIAEAAAIGTPAAAVAEGIPYPTLYGWLEKVSNLEDVDYQVHAWDAVAMQSAEYAAQVATRVAADLEPERQASNLRSLTALAVQAADRHLDYRDGRRNSGSQTIIAIGDAALEALAQARAQLKTSVVEVVPGNLEEPS